MKNKLENMLFGFFNPIASIRVWAKRTDLALRLQDDFAASMNLFQAAIYFGYIKNPWPQSSHNGAGELTPKLGQVAVPQE